ncbi:MAG: acyl-CoA/acyl-ACP dehydrogenase [Desulfofustis sp.]|nr:acyl-CoA/acyl-ACP dehydrogenase [Desulfofustis sp.]
MEKQNIESFINECQLALRNALTTYPEIETTNYLQGLPKELVEKIFRLKPLSLFIPESYGGRGGTARHRLALLEAISYESIGVGLMMGINGSLFLEPVSKYGQEETKTEIYNSFLNSSSLGGLMITEPDFGTDALSMRTSYSQIGNHVHLKGAKHWGGLTGLADFWIVTGRKIKPNNKLARDIDLFVVDRNKREQKISVDEYYHKLGLFLIPYGLNNIDARIPATSRLIPKTSGIKLMMDLLHRSRLRLSGIGLGFIKRMLDEAVNHCRQRYVGGKSLMAYDQVQHRISLLQACFTVSSAMCHYTAGVSSIRNDLTSYALQANAAKSVLTDMMHDSAQSLLQLTGAKGYRRDHIAGRAVVDSRPFQIFEGSNDVMYSQVADYVLKKMKESKYRNLYDFLNQLELTTNAADHFKDVISFDLNFSSVQRARVKLGKIIAKLITANFTFNLYETDFQEDLVDNALEVIGNELASMISSLKQSRLVSVVENYSENSDWKLYQPLTTAIV